MTKTFETPILLIIFNRPDTTERVFGEIKKIRPSKLFIVADGARPGRPGEVERCRQAKEIVERIDWACQVHKNYSDINLGCRRRVSSGIDWFFENVEQGIILEDDCLPNVSFFNFCAELLEKYKDDERIGMVSGDNFQFGKIKNKASFYFSRYAHIWGWATWRRAWQKYDVCMSDWPQARADNKLAEIFKSKKDVFYWTLIFNDVYAGKIDTWDYQWTYASFMNDYLSVMPSKNLVSNIGFGSLGATHTKHGNKFSAMMTDELDWPLAYPSEFSREVASDALVQKNNYPFWRYVIKRVMFKGR